jgi:hypothetical protein
MKDKSHMKNNNNTLGVRVFVTENGLVISSNYEQKELEKYPEITDFITNISWRQNLKTLTIDKVEMEILLDEEKQIGIISKESLRNLKRALNECNEG